MKIFLIFVNVVCLACVFVHGQDVTTAAPGPEGGAVESTTAAAAGPVGPVASTIKCYICNSTAQANCGFKLKDGDKFVMECPEGMDVCLLEVTKDGAKASYKRDCAMNSTAGPDCDKKIKEKNKTPECKLCNTEKCNADTKDYATKSKKKGKSGASVVSPFASTMTFFFAVAFIMAIRKPN